MDHWSWAFKIWYEHTYKLCVNSVYKPALTETATVQAVEIVSDKFNINDIRTK